LVFTSSVSVVDQNIVLFNDSIRNNVSMWDKFTEDEEIIRALQDAQIYDDVMKLRGGLSYVLTEGGTNFSGGQRQRLEIARALATNPAVIILDEATSALDAKTEGEVIAAIQRRGITSIVIAHRLSTIRDCDEIIVFDDGKVIERGTHEVLYAQNGKYTALVTNE
ncbi:MAG: ATP-binding cassette domain-containing protein, partial [Eubacterium sp.]